MGPMRSMTCGWGKDGRITVDMVLGATVFGVVGAAIGYYWGTTASLAAASAVGVVFGTLIGLLGGPAVLHQHRVRGYLRRRSCLAGLRNGCGAPRRCFRRSGGGLSRSATGDADGTAPAIESVA